MRDYSESSVDVWNQKPPSLVDHGWSGGGECVVTLICSTLSSSDVLTCRNYFFYVLYPEVNFLFNSDIST